jgi:hypothetical protein
MEWFEEGGRNTAFYQAKALERTKSNHITTRKKEDDSMVTKKTCRGNDQRFLCRSIHWPTRLAGGTNIGYVLEKVTEPMNEVLTSPFTREEVKRALFMMGASKAPRSDGLTTGLYHFHWERDFFPHQLKWRHPWCNHQKLKLGGKLSSQ